MKRQGWKAFTLIELLVVVAIIALLLSIIMPALRVAKEQARRVVCTSHLGQVGKALESYGSAYDYRRLDIRPAGSTNEYWMGQLTPFFSDDHYAVEDGLQKVIDILMCPSAPASNYVESSANANASGYWGTASAPWEWKRSATKSTLGGYSINGWVVYDSSYDQASGFKEYVYRNWLDVSPTVPLFGDGIWPIGWPRGTDQAPPDLQGCVNAVSRNAELNMRDEMRRFCIDRHNRKNNVIFKDLHVEARGIDNLWELRWHKSYQPPATPIRLPSK